MFLKKETFLNLVIVESPIKEKKIQEYLQDIRKEKKDLDFFHVLGTGGHIVNIAKSKDYGVMGVTYENGVFSADFQPIPSQKKVISEIKALSKKATNIFICTDDDREGERIADDIVEVCKIKKYFRATFTEITKKAIQTAIVDRVGVRLIDEKIVLAQWTRRIADRIIGYGFSPVLSYIFKKNKTLEVSDSKTGEEYGQKPSGTGRIIGIALSLLVERQKNINAFKETGGVLKDIVYGGYSYNGVYFRAKGVGLEYSRDRSDLMQDVIAKANTKIHRVETYEPELTEYPPYPPFTTATIYSAISYVYSIPPFEAKKILQDLYETGYINYPRTDSIKLSDEIVDDIISYLFETSSTYEHDDIIREKRNFSKKGKDTTQEAHEAIRPIFINKEHEPKKIAEVWNKDKNCGGFGNNHLSVYELIWKRTIATQYKNSIYDTSTLIIKAGEFYFKTRSMEVVYAGWEQLDGDVLHASEKGKEGEDWNKRPVILPKGLHIGLILESADVSFSEKIPKAPKRLSEGALIAKLNNLGIARPSSLHTISHTLREKKYAVSYRTLLTPTELGTEVFEITNTYANWINDIEQAVQFEQIIHSIETGAFTDANKVLQIFWDAIEKIKEEVGYATYSAKDTPPTQKQIEYFDSIFEKLSDDEKKLYDRTEILKNQQGISSFLNKIEEKKKERLSNSVLGVCPKCDSNSVVLFDSGYRCFKKSCDFVLWNNAMASFFSNFQKEEPEKQSFGKSLFNQEKQTVVENLINKNGDFFEGNVEVGFSKDRNRWEIVFAKKETKVEEL